jgi:hypothetical protein
MTEAETLETPKTYDEALALRGKLIEEVDSLQDVLAANPYGPHRTDTLTRLRRARALLRQVKEWLRKNDVVKQSEWTLLARAHALLQALEPVATGHAEDIEQLLDAIELVVPGQYLGRAE